MIDIIILFLLFVKRERLLIFFKQIIKLLKITNKCYIIFISIFVYICLKLSAFIYFGKEQNDAGSL